MLQLTARLILPLWALASLLVAPSNGFISPIGRPKLKENAIRTRNTRNSYRSSRLFASTPANEVNDEFQDDCPRGYYLDTKNGRCNKLGLIGSVSQRVETVGPLKRVSKAISDLFGIDHKKISSLGVTFALSYSIISNINGSVSLSVAWYMSCQRTGLSPLAPGQWKSLLKAYGTLYAILQLLRPFRVATAIAMSKLSGEFLEMTQEKLDCSRASAIFFQYIMGLVVWIACGTTGILLASIFSGVPIW